MDSINYTPQDILHKQFKEKSIGKGYDMADVDEFLDNVIKDYDAYNKEVDRLNDENERLKAKVDELNRQVEVSWVIEHSYCCVRKVHARTGCDACSVCAR